MQFSVQFTIFLLMSLLFPQLSMTLVIENLFTLIHGILKIKKVMYNGSIVFQEKKTF